MKKGGILNPALAKLLAETGHTDYLVVTDAGLPLPENVNTRIDFALKPNVPRFLELLDTVLEEIVVEKIILAEEIKVVSPQMHEEILKRFTNIPIEYMPHVQLKEASKQARGLIRSGEFTPFANVILVAGCAY
ncbi:MAG: D-ribose pyranase [Desulfosporosinus sp.]|nr:D-ribose pyranase [Desulfosporosinus sp.]